ncbi:adenylyl-sulfate kinase [Brachybacterium hainanense]|uniref:Adenylyl-sulfate kinase n=1 Tax=Brachybacterium hainanense TaxID=1541174 RepID=A0ABV6R8S3_9MICO
MPEDAPETLLLTGTVGAGKTTTAFAIGELLQDRGIPHAVIDLDEIRRQWPHPPADPFGEAVQMANLRDVAANYRRAGARRLVLAGVLEDQDKRADFARALGGTAPVVCRLAVELDRVRERLRSRHEPGAAREWHLARSGELDAILIAGAVADHVVPVAAEAPSAVAERVLAEVGWD